MEKVDKIKSSWQHFGPVVNIFNMLKVIIIDTMIFRPMLVRQLQFCLIKFANHESSSNLTQPLPTATWNYERFRGS